VTSHPAPGAVRARSPAVSPWLLDLASVAAGACQVLAFAPFAWRPFSVAGMAALLLLWRLSAPARAAWRGLLAGLGLFGCGVYWVYNSLHDFGAAPAPVAAVGTAGLVLILALFTAALGWLSSSLQRRGLGLAPLALLGFPGLLTLLEWGREQVLGGFPWLAPAYALLDTPLAGWAAVAGPAGLNLIAGLLAGALLLTLIADNRRRLLALTLVAGLLAGGLALQQPQWTRPTGPPMQIALVQGNVAQDLKWRPEWRRRTLETYAELTRSAPPVRLLLWPETAVPAYLDLLADYTRPLAELVAARGGVLLLGAPTRDQGGRSYNSLVLLGPQVQAYHKRHLVPFGEFIPMRGLVERLGGLVQIPMSDFSAGAAKQPLLRAGGVALGASICFEVAFADEVRRALPAAELLVNVSNDAWFGDSLAPHQHLEMARLRALESGRYLLRATNTGISAVIAPDGSLRERSAQFTRAVLSAQVEPRSGATPFVRWGQWPALALGLLLLMVASFMVSRRR